MPNNLKLYEAIMLLALCEAKGTMNGAYIEYVTAGAIAAELLLLKRIKTDESNKETVVVLDDSPTGDRLLDEALSTMTEAKRPRKLKDWVQKLGCIKKLKHKVAQALADDGIVKHEKEKILWLFERQIYPEVNPEPERRLRQAMRDAVLDDSHEIEPRIAITVALAKSARLLPQVFSKQELKEYKQRIKQLERGDLVSQATKEAVQAIEAAVMVAVMMPAITAATAPSSGSC